MAFTDPGVGAFTLAVAGGSAEFRAGDAPVADLVMTQSTATFVKTLNGMQDPAAAMQTGEIQVNDHAALATFGQLFPMG
jgi:putative sterol carrier protein